LTAELEPALIEDGFVQAGPGPYVLARLLGTPCRRPGHIPYLQLLDTHHRVVLADRGRGLVQEVAAGVADMGMNTLDAGFCLLPVAAESGFADYRLLRLAQRDFVPLEAVEWRVERAVRQRSETGHVDADRTAVGDRLYNLALGLDADETLATQLADADVSHLTRHVLAVAIAQPAEFWQENAEIGLIELDLLRVGIAKTVALTLLLEAWKLSPLGEEVSIGPLQVSVCCNGCVGAALSHGVSVPLRHSVSRLHNPA
tara:strand:+ start:8035 stop:8805 length:771 start_codon:yes stop_codon:yes gene_type:complete